MLGAFWIESRLLSDVDCIQLAYCLRGAVNRCRVVSRLPSDKEAKMEEVPLSWASIRKNLREKEYGHDPKTFLTNVGSLDRDFRTLRDWHAGKTKPLLVKGATGVGKSRLVAEFLRDLGFWERIRRRVLMPTLERCA